MIHSNTSFGKLKEVIVGRELNLTRRIADITFKYFYKEALEQGLYRKDFGGYEISYEILQTRR
jgi:glycine amidinotransferase